MAPRANWKGYLKLSLVACAIALYPASSTASRISFNTLNRKTGNKVKRVYVDPDTDEEVPSEDQMKGYPISKHDFIIVTDEELDSVKIESSQTVEIEKFVPRSQIDPRYMDAPYYIAPDDRVAQEPFAVIRDAMKGGDVVGIGRVVISRRERLMMLEPWEKGILGTVLRYGYEVRDAKGYFEDIPEIQIPDDMHDLAKVIVDRKLSNWDPTEFTDRYEDAVAQLIQTKQKTGEAPVQQELLRPRTVISIMDALRESVARETDVATARTPSKSTSSADVSASPQAKPLAPPKSRKADTAAPAAKRAKKA